MKRNNTHITRVPKGEEREQEIKNLFEEIMTKNFPTLVKEKDIQVQEAQRAANKIDSKRPKPRHIKIKMAKVKNKERILLHISNLPFIFCCIFSITIYPAYTLFHLHPHYPHPITTLLSTKRES